MDVEEVARRQPRTIWRQLRRSLSIDPSDREVSLADMADGSATSAAPTLIVDDLWLSTTDDDSVRAALGRAAASLSPSGRIGLRELCLRPDIVPDERAAELSAAASDLFDGSWRPRSPSVWWSLIEDAGFEIVHRLDGDVWLPRRRRRQGRFVVDELGVVAFVAIPTVGRAPGTEH